jgi:hypothetical protein
MVSMKASKVRNIGVHVRKEKQRMTTRHFVITGVAVLLAAAVGLRAQTTTSKVTAAAGDAKVTTEQIRGEVVVVEGNWLLVRLQPSGQYRYFNIPPGRPFIIDGQTRLISDLRSGTVLTATAITTTQPVTVRTTTVTNGTVWYASGNYVVLTLASGENREYIVPPTFRFVVEGKPASVSDLRKGMKVSGEKVVEEPRTEISTKTVIEGNAPK